MTLYKYKSLKDFLIFKINILNSSISSLRSCGITITDLILEKKKLEEQLESITFTAQIK